MSRLLRIAEADYTTSHLGINCNWLSTIKPVFNFEARHLREIGNISAKNSCFLHQRDSRDFKVHRSQSALQRAVGC